MLSIEEARAALITHLISHCGDEGHPKAQCCPPLADAYALAVLDRAQTTWRKDPEEYMQQQNALRERIEELGK